MAQPSLLTGGLGFANWSPGFLLTFGLGSFSPVGSSSAGKILSVKHSLHLSTGSTALLRPSPHGEDASLRSFSSVNVSALI